MTLLLLLPLLILAPAAAGAQQITISHGTDADSVSRIVPRMPLAAARHAIVTRDGLTALLLTERGVVLQLTDRGLREVVRDTETEPQKEGLLAELISGMVRGGVRAMLDRGIEYPLSHLRDARYAEGRLSFTSTSGAAVFQDVSINGVDVMAGFRPAEARDFASRVRAARTGR